MPTTVRLKVCCVDSVPPGAPDESVTLRVKLEVPPAEGIPKISPALFKLNPFGSVPLATLQFRGCTPPAAVSVVS